MLKCALCYICIVNFTLNRIMLSSINILLLVIEHWMVLGPEYISALLRRYEPSRPLRSSGSGLLSAPRVRTGHGEAAISFYSFVEQTSRKLQVCSNSNLFQIKTEEISVCRSFSPKQFQGFRLHCDFYPLVSFKLVLFQLIFLFFVFVLLFLMYFKCTLQRLLM